MVTTFHRVNCILPFMNHCAMQAKHDQAPAMAAAVCCIANLREPALLSDKNIAWVAEFCKKCVPTRRVLHAFIESPEHRFLRKCLARCQLSSPAPKKRRLEAIADALVLLNEYLSRNAAMPHPTDLPSEMTGPIEVEIAVSGPYARAYYIARKPYVLFVPWRKLQRRIRQIVAELTSTGCGPMPDEPLDMARFKHGHPAFYGAFRCAVRPCPAHADYFIDAPSTYRFLVYRDTVPTEHAGEISVKTFRTLEWGNKK